MTAGIMEIAMVVCVFLHKPVDIVPLLILIIALSTVLMYETYVRVSSVSIFYKSF